MTKETTELVNSSPSHSGSSWNILNSAGYHIGVSNPSSYHIVTDEYKWFGGMTVDSNNNIYIADGYDSSSPSTSKLFKLTTNSGLTAITAASVYIDGTNKTTFRTPLVSRIDMRDTFICGNGHMNNFTSSIPWNVGSTGYIGNLSTGGLDIFINKDGLPRTGAQPGGNSTGSCPYQIPMSRFADGAHVNGSDWTYNSGSINYYGDYIWYSQAGQGGSYSNMPYMNQVKFLNDSSKVTSQSGNISLVTKVDSTFNNNITEGIELKPLSIDPGVGTSKAKSITLEAENVNVMGNFVLKQVTTTEMNELSATPGTLIYNTTVNKVYAWNGTSWNALW